MKAVRVLVATTGLVLTLLPSILFFKGWMAGPACSRLMLAGMVLWFGSKCLPVGRRKG